MYENLDKLIKLENKYGNIHNTNINEEVFTWREITQEEFTKAIRFYSDEEERQEYICRLCIIEPKNYDFSNCYAGIPNTLSRNILLESGHLEQRGMSMLNQARNELTNFENQIAPIVCAAFPKFTLEDVESWTFRKQIKYLSRAEFILTNLYGYNISIGNNTEQNIDYDAFPELQNQHRKR